MATGIKTSLFVTNKQILVFWLRLEFSIKTLQNSLIKHSFASMLFLIVTNTLHYYARIYAGASCNSTQTSCVVIKSFVHSYCSLVLKLSDVVTPREELPTRLISQRKTIILLNRVIAKLSTT